MLLTNKIYRRITDFRGNKIKNAKVDNPQKDEEIANKSYVDEKGIYNTEKAKKSNTSPNFPWIANVYNESIKSIIDKILYGKETEVYTNPVIENFHLTIVENINNDNENIINSGIATLYRFEFVNGYTQRKPLSNPKIKIVYNNDSEKDFVFTNDEYSKNTGYGRKEIEIDFLSIKHIYIIQEYDLVRDDDVPKPFDALYTMKEDVLPKIKQNYLILEPIYYYKIGDDEFKNIYALNTKDEKIQACYAFFSGKLNLFTSGNEIELVPDVHNRYAFIFNGDNLINCNLNVYIKDVENNRILSTETYSYEDFEVKVFKKVSELSSMMGSYSNLIYTDVTKINSFVFVYWEMGYFDKNLKMTITFDKLYHKN